MMILTYSLVYALSNNYLKVIIKSLEAKILNEKVEVLFYKIKLDGKISSKFKAIVDSCHSFSDYVFLSAGIR